MYLHFISFSIQMTLFLSISSLPIFSSDFDTKYKESKFRLGRSGWGYGKYVVLQVFKCLNKRTVLSHGSCFNRSSFVATLFCDALRTSVQSKGEFNTAFSMRSMHSRISFSIVPRFRLRTYAQFSDFSPFLHRIMHDH